MIHKASAILFLLSSFLFAQERAIQPKSIDLEGKDGTLLKATYYPAAKAGPGVLLFHQCNKQRKAWDGLAEMLSKDGFHVLTMDYRGFGESGGKRYEDWSTQELQENTSTIWPQDIDIALQYLLKQPGVRGSKIGAGGASCGVDQAVQLARRHPEVRSLVLLSGFTDHNGRAFLRHSSKIPILISAASDDGRIVESMRWLKETAPNPKNDFLRFDNGGHGTDMFTLHPELETNIVKWFASTLEGRGSPSKHEDTGYNKALYSRLDILDQEGGPARALQMVGEAHKNDPSAVLFSEGIVNLLGYERLQASQNEEAIAIFKINVAQFPHSANALDSLADGYVAAKQNDLALQSAQRAQDLLPNDSSLVGPGRKAVQDSIEQKLKQLKPTPSS